MRADLWPADVDDEPPTRTRTSWMCEGCGRFVPAASVRYLGQHPEDWTEEHAGDCSRCGAGVAVW